MHDLIFVNLPVTDLGRSRAFYTDVGYTFNEDYCGGGALCLELGPTLHAMLLERSTFDRFHDGVQAPPGTVGALLCLSARSRAEVDGVVDRALRAGGSEGRTQDQGDMYGRSYADPDGHVWEILWMEQTVVAHHAPAGTDEENA